MKTVGAKRSARPAHRRRRAAARGERPGFREAMPLEAEDGTADSGTAGAQHTQIPGNHGTAALLAFIRMRVYIEGRAGSHRPPHPLGAVSRARGAGAAPPAR